MFEVHLSGEHLQERLGQGLMYPPKNEHGGGGSDNEETRTDMGNKTKEVSR